MATAGRLLCMLQRQLQHNAERPTRGAKDSNSTETLRRACVSEGWTLRVEQDHRSGLPGTSFELFQATAVIEGPTLSRTLRAACSSSLDAALAESGAMEQLLLEPEVQAALAPRTWPHDITTPVVQPNTADLLLNPKGRLGMLLQQAASLMNISARSGWLQVTYTSERSGPNHTPCFTVSASVAMPSGEISAQGTGGMKRAAEQAAASQLLAHPRIQDLEAWVKVQAEGGLGVCPVPDHWAWPSTAVLQPISIHDDVAPARGAPAAAPDAALPPPGPSDISLLNNVCQTKRWKLEFTAVAHDGPPHNPCIQLRAAVEGAGLPASGVMVEAAASSVKAARAVAARLLLEHPAVNSVATCRRPRFIKS